VAAAGQAAIFPPAEITVALDTRIDWVTLLKRVHPVGVPGHAHSAAWNDFGFHIHLPQVETRDAGVSGEVRDQPLGRAICLPAEQVERTPDRVVSVTHVLLIATGARGVRIVAATFADFLKGQPADLRARLLPAATKRSAFDPARRIVYRILTST
jgi:hypothetical protein